MMVVAGCLALMQAGIPVIDLDLDLHRQVIVDREKNQYLGHVTTALLGDSRTILAVYPKGHGKGAIVMKRSQDGGRSWSDRLDVPADWATSREVPTLYRLSSGRLILWTGLYPARYTWSDDHGRKWEPLREAGDWGGIVVMSSLVELKNGSLLALFHDDGRFFRSKGNADGVFRLYSTTSSDRGEHWSAPKEIYRSTRVHLCEAGAVRSPDGREIAILLRENRRIKNSHVMFSRDEGQSWSSPRELAETLSGDRHTARYAKDGRLLVTFREMSRAGPMRGDWMVWVGRWDDLRTGNPGQFRIRLKDNQDSWDCGYSGFERLPDDTFVATTYGHWEAGEEPYILSVRFNLREMDARLGDKK